MKQHRLTDFAFLAALLLGLPLLGAALAGFPLGRFLEFPPISRHHAPAPFAWPAFIGLALFEVLLYLPVLFLLKSQVSRFGNRMYARFPRWGFIALAWTAAWWTVAWTRLPALAAIQAHTFTPLWLGYIAVINACTFARTGRCMLTHQPRRLLALFTASAGFWWFFEYLNRFVQNWYYEGIASFSPACYLLFATPAFATVLPAVLGTFELLDERSAAVQRQIAEAAAKSGAARGTVRQQIGDLYGSGMDEAKLEADGIAPVKPFLAEVETIKDAASLANYLRGQFAAGRQYVFSFGPTEDFKDAKSVIGYAFQDGLSLPEKAYYSEAKYQDKRDAFVAHVERMLVLGGVVAAALGMGWIG